MKVHELLSDESKWTKGVYARGADGRPLATSDPDATCFCLLGGLRICYPNLDERRAMTDRVKLEIERKYPQVHEHESFTTSVSKFNDAHDYQTVYGLVKELDI